MDEAISDLPAFKGGPEDAPRWVLNQSLDLLVQALEMVEDLSGLREGLAGYANATALAQVVSGGPLPEAEQVGRVWAALSVAAGAVQAQREEDEIARRKDQNGHA